MFCGTLYIGYPSSDLKREKNTRISGVSSLSKTLAVIPLNWSLGCEPLEDLSFGILDLETFVITRLQARKAQQDKEVGFLFQSSNFNNMN